MLLPRLEINKLVVSLIIGCLTMLLSSTEIFCYNLFDCAYKMQTGNGPEVYTLNSGHYNNKRLKKIPIDYRHRQAQPTDFRLIPIIGTTTFISCITFLVYLSRYDIGLKMYTY